MTRPAVWLATAFGAGYAPIAPGTAGSAVAVGLYLLTMHWPLAWQAAVLLAVTAIGIPVSTRAAAHFGREDPSPVVIDEVAGQLLTLFATGAGLWGAVVGFFLFRAADIVKPWPARQFERFHGGLGIMADDLMAAVYANIALQILMRVFSGYL
jgi:phosphatidylglycerophosphatase A